MSTFIDKIVGDMGEKKEWKAIEARANKLPEDYRTVYAEIKKYVWGTSGISTIDPFKTLIDLFEESAAEGRNVLDITGDNVAAFADELVRGEKSYFEDRREKLNKNVTKKLSK